ncbi:MAG: STAS domain-containing protein [Anaerolineae bacterium]|nr:STAS domain-containing protein [Anaerolineae bacterium]
MEIQTEQPNSQTLVLRLSGRFDANTIGDVKSRWTAQDVIHYVIIDLSGTTFIDSMALATLSSGMKTTRQRGGELLLVNLSEVARVIFELTSMDKAFRILPTVDEALTLTV